MWRSCTEWSQADIDKHNKEAQETNKVWGENELKRKEKIGDNFGFEKDKSTINQQQPTTSGTQSSTSKDNDKSTKLQ